MDGFQSLVAIQSLKGNNPGKKRKTLHSIAIEIVKNDKEKSEFVQSGHTDRIHPALLPHLRIIIANKLKNYKMIIEALKSNDSIIVDEALRAKWFFKSSEDILNVDNFFANIFPYISMRTMLKLIKRLSYCLSSQPEKAETFFLRFTELVGFKTAFPLIAACNEKFIEEMISKYNLNHKKNFFHVLFKKHLMLVVNHLLNLKEKLFKTDESEYYRLLSYRVDLQSFLPLLVKNYAEAFIELSKRLYPNRLSKTKQNIILREAKDTIIQEPCHVLWYLDLKMIHDRLKPTEYETMLENCFPKNLELLYSHHIERILEFYPKEERFTIFKNKFQLIYGQDFSHYMLKRQYRSYSSLLSNLYLRKELAKENYEYILKNPEARDTDNFCFLPPEESIYRLKKLIEESSNNNLSLYIDQMITSCALYDSKKGLLEVLRYYNSKHAKVDHGLLENFLRTLDREFNYKNLDTEHWDVLKDIILRAHCNSHFFNIFLYTRIKFFCDASERLFNLNALNSEEMKFRDTLVHLILEDFLEHDNYSDYERLFKNISKKCADACMVNMKKKYGKNHKIWQNIELKLQTTREFLEMMLGFADSNESSPWNFDSEDWSQLADFTKELLNVDSPKEKIREFKQFVRKHDPERYHKWIDSSTNFEDLNKAISSGLSIISKSEADWIKYSNLCRTGLTKNSKSAKKFVHAIKWHQHLPIKFVEKCLEEINEEGSILVLGLLSDDAHELCKIVLKKYEEKIPDSVLKNLIKATNFSNPLVSFDLISKYGSRTANNNLTALHRKPFNEVIEFSKSLSEKSIKEKKLGIHLIYWYLELLPEDIVSGISNNVILECSFNFILNMYLAPDHKMFDHRLSLFMQELIGSMKKKNEPHPEMPGYYPAHIKLQKFIPAIVRELLMGKHSFGSKIIDETMKTFLSVLKPCEDPKNYVWLCLCKEFFISKELNIVNKLVENFGKNLINIVREVGSEIVLYDIALIWHTAIEWHTLPFHNLLIIRTLSEADDHYGSVVSIYLLSIIIRNKGFGSYRSYVKIMKTWLSSSYPNVKIAVNNLMNNPIKLRENLYSFILQKKEGNKS